MCGRFALITPPVRLARYFQATLDDGVDPEQRPSWNVAPTTTVLGVTARRHGGAVERAMSPFRWGLIPSWSKDAASGSRLFNARGETVTTKPSFRGAFEARRIIVPADGPREGEQAAPLLHAHRRPAHGVRRALGVVAGQERAR